jgi:hypothetical protein
MQYPTLSAAALEDILSSEPPTKYLTYPEALRFSADSRKSASKLGLPPGVSILSNENISRAVAKLGYESVFMDRFTFAFGVHFGHATPLGNRLLAENVIRFLEKNKLLPRH